MKHLTALALFASIAACSQSNSSKSSNAPTSGIEVTKPNLSGYDLCDINWTDEKIDAITKLNNFDLPLPIDVALFKTVARQQLSEIFGGIEVPAGKVHYQDMLGTGTTSYFDFARIHYTAKMPAEIAFHPDISMTYAVSAAGQAVVGFTKVIDNHLRFAFPGLVVMYNKASEDLEPGVVGLSNQEFIDRMAEIKKNVAPDLTWNNDEAITGGFLLWTPVKLPENPSPAQVAQFVKLWKTFEADPAVASVDYDGEFIIGSPTTGEMILIKDNETSIDMNKMRSVSLQKVTEGGIFATLPSLPKPFGEGCTIDNPKAPND